MDQINIALAFIAGVATAAGSYIAWLELRRAQPRVELVSVWADSRVPDGLNAAYTFRCRLLNRSPVGHAVLNIQWRPTDRHVLRMIPYRDYYDSKWLTLVIDELIPGCDEAFRKPMPIGPFEYKEIDGYWTDPWSINDPTRQWRAKQIYERREVREAVTRLHDAVCRDDLEYRVVLADGSSQRYRFPNRRYRGSPLGRLLLVLRRRLPGRAA
ncbi:MAG: hypothetical protein A3G93_13040 [Nitrospinae bacterium RIFCSPLOWO2_12_FULL_45_22]|nr:MAG: hypothetical protein A3G93_13040 [Nitrospinae bacterium RIFCSPLOWO2_12_FULL_45_22]